MNLCYGSTRVVWLIGPYAIKVPTVVEWRLFLQGILANLHEKRWSDAQFEGLAPVLWCGFAGLVLIMSRCEQLYPSDVKEPDMLDEWEQWLALQSDNDREMYRNIVEPKLSSLGYYRGRIVALDYGS